MPFYSLALTVPVNTPATAPATQDLHIYPGVITQLAIQFPKGCAGLVHATLMRVGSQVWPASPDSDLSTDGNIILAEEQYDITDEPLRLTLSAYNLDDTYPHTITLWVTTVDADQVQAQRQTASMLTKFLQLVGLK